MGNINLGRVVMGGLLAGLVLNVFDYVTYGVILADDYDAALQALGKSGMSTGMIAWYVALDFIWGIFLVGLYAAIRPRFGSGPKTAVFAGLAAWFLAIFMHAMYEAPIDLFPMNLWWIGTIVALIGIPIAAVAGAWLYQEPTPE